ncbi:hypothetical protein OC846_002231 [Tilletia horrida]|uniref:SAM-dependent MTase RsmB/NOP-type domain-containing protein n=1 Tax=Tilletia horrida TaxID=155126 RepID=A0AAN6GRI6_9BASI|nr:hypothetical protein OC846_002231 [Tilletia horrida]
MDFYLRTAQVLDRATLGQSSSLKSHVTSLSHNQGDAKRLLALSVSCLSYKPTLDELVSFSQKSLLNAPKDWKVFESAVELRSHGAESKSSHAAANKPEAKDTPKASRPKKDRSCRPETLLLVLLHDLLFSPKKAIQASSSWPPHAVLQKHKTRLRAELTRLQIRSGKSRLEDLRVGGEDRKRAERIPRWARVNTGKTSLQAVKTRLESEGWTAVPGPQLVKGRHFSISELIPSLLAFHPSSTSALLSHELYTSGHLILQDLASCFPAQILASGFEGRAIEAIDATAAPGNKTSHLSALLGPAAKITAFELSPQRHQTLSSQLGKAGCLSSADGQVGQGKKRKREAHDHASSDGTQNVVALQADFLETDPTDKRWQNVKLMLLDPSCSGSSTDEQEADESSTASLTARLAALSAFQLTMIKHAMQFPRLQRVVYSTCSIHAEEDEHVVLAALGSEEAKRGGWKLMSRKQVLPDWPIRGRPEECNSDTEIADSVIRCVPGGDEGRVEGVEPGSVHVEASNGFFVAGFERSLEDEAEAEAEAEAGTDTEDAEPEAKKRKAKSKKKKKKKKKANVGSQP